MRTARGAKPLARLARVQSDRSNRAARRRRRRRSTRMWQSSRRGSDRGQAAVISGATGAEPATAEERAWLATMPDVPVRATGTYIGHGIEPQFAMNIALATLALGHESCSPATASGDRAAMDRTAGPGRRHRGRPLARRRHGAGRSRAVKEKARHGVRTGTQRPSPSPAWASSPRSASARPTTGRS